MEGVWRANNNMESNGTREEYSKIRRSRDILELTQCLICLGILRKTRTIMECLHRFCRECIGKAMLLGRKECPTCRTHCASRRSLRDDPQFDALIAALYPDLEKLEIEEFTLLEENLENNKKTQRRISEVFQRQSEALTKFKRQKPSGNKAAGVSKNAESEYRSDLESGIDPDLNKHATAETSTDNELESGIDPDLNKHAAAETSTDNLKTLD